MRSRPRSIKAVAAASRFTRWSILLLLTGLLAGFPAGCSALRWSRGDRIHPEDLDRLKEGALCADQVGVRIRERPDGGYDALSDVLSPREGRSRLTMLSGTGQAALPVVRIRINNKTVYAMLDSGSTRSLVDWRGALRLGLQPLRLAAAPESDQALAADLVWCTLTGLGATVRGFAARAGSLRFGSLPFGPTLWWIADDPRGLFRYGWMGQQRVEALVGYDLLCKVNTVTFDYTRRRVDLSSEGPYQPDPESPLLLTAPLRPSLGLPVMPGLLNDRPALFALDSGGDFELWVPRKLAESHGLKNGLDLRGLRRGQGLGGETLSVPGGAVQVRLAGHPVGPLQASLSVVTPGEHEQPVILLGARFMTRYRITLDHVMGLVYFEER